MSEHKLPQEVRQRRGLVGIRAVPRDASAEARSMANRRRKYAGYRTKPWHGLPGDAREYGKLAGKETAEEAAVAARLAKVDAGRRKGEVAA